MLQCFKNMLASFVTDDEAVNIAHNSFVFHDSPRPRNATTISDQHSKDTEQERLVNLFD